MSEFSSTALGRVKKKQLLQKATVQSRFTTMVWRLRETWALQVDFFQFCTSREGIQHICLIYTKLHALSCGYRLSLFLGGPIALHGLVHFLDTTGPFLTKVVYAYFDRSSCIYIYIYIIHTYSYSDRRKRENGKVSWQNAKSSNAPAS